MVTSGRRTPPYYEASLKAGDREVHHQINFDANFDKVDGLINVVVTLQKTERADFIKKGSREKRMGLFAGYYEQFDSTSLFRLQ